MVHSSEASKVAVRLLGVPGITVATRSEFPSRGYYLLTMLALASGRRLTRAQVAVELWDGTHGANNLTNLRQLLLRMNRSLPDLGAILGVDNNAIWLNGDGRQIDLCQLLHLGTDPAEASLRAATDLYRGDLLQGRDDMVRQGAGDSLALSRSFVRERFFSVATECIKEIVHYGQADLALLRAAEFSMLSVDGAREDTYRGFIAAYGAIGRVDEARRVYDALAQVLELDGTGRPIAETRLTLKRATARVVDDLVETAKTRPRQTHRPRLALLAPRWVTGGRGGQNFHRALIEDVANELARYRTLVTIASHSAFLAKEDGGLIVANDTLRADYSLSSVIVPAVDGGTLRVRLVDSQSAAIIWVAEFPLRHQQVITASRLLVSQLAAEVSTAIESESFERARRTDNPASYLTFLRGQDALKSSNLKSLRRARSAYKAAIAEDDAFADAYSGLSCSLFFEWIVLGGNDPRLLADARELAERAIAHDPANAAGHWRKADVLLYQRDFDGSEVCFRRALELHPNSADILLHHADAKGHIGDPDEAWGMFEHALELNPTPPENYWWTGAGIAFSQGRYQKAIDLCDHMESEEPVLRLLAATHGQLGNRREAREYGRRLLEMYPAQSAEEMSRLQPHRSKEHLQPFIDGLRMAGVK